MSPTPPAPAPAPLSGCSYFRLRQAGRLAGRLYDAELATLGLKTTQYSLLSALAALGPARPGELAGRLGLSPSTLTRNLRPLIAQGWVAVGPGADERSRQVALTLEGRQKRSEAQRAWKRAQLAFNERLGPERVARLHAVLDECQALLAEPTAEESDTA